MFKIIKKNNLMQDTIIDPGLSPKTVVLYRQVGSGNGDYTYDRITATFTNVGAGNGDFLEVSTPTITELPVNFQDIDCKITRYAELKDITTDTSPRVINIETSVSKGYVNMYFLANLATHTLQVPLSLRGYIEDTDISNGQTGFVDGLRSSIIHTKQISSPLSRGINLIIELTKDVKFKSSIYNVIKVAEPKGGK